MRFLSGSDVLSSVETAGRTRPRRHVAAAVAYVGARAPEYLPLQEGDLIVVNGSDNAVAMGATSVDALRTWYEAGVAVVSHERVHAKVIIVGRTVYVGSANLSDNARRGHTVEAAIVSTDPAIVSAARALIQELVDDGEDVDQHWLELKETIKVTRTPPPYNPKSSFLPDSRFDLWIVGIEDHDFSPAEEELAQQGRRVHTTKDRRYRIECLAGTKYDPEDLHAGDLVVFLRARSAKLVRFLERKRSGSAAVGFYRSDRELSTVKLQTLRAALAMPNSTDLTEDGSWQRVGTPARGAVLGLWNVTDHGARTRAR